MDEHKALQVAAAVGAGAEEVLREIRLSPSDVEYWRNAILLEGLIGHADVWQELTTFLRSACSLKGARTLTPEVFRANVFLAKMSVLRSLGFLANQSQDPQRTQILSYLKDSIKPSIWEARHLAWRSPNEEEEGNRVRNVELSRQAIIALGLSGENSAGDLLKSLSKVFAHVSYDQNGIARFAIPAWNKESLTEQNVVDFQQAIQEAIQTNEALHRTPLSAYLSPRP